MRVLPASMAEVIGVRRHFESDCHELESDTTYFPRSEISAEASVTTRPSAVATTSAPSGATSVTSASKAGSSRRGARARAGPGRRGASARRRARRRSRARRTPRAPRRAPRASAAEQAAARAAARGAALRDVGHRLVDARRARARPAGSSRPRRSPRRSAPASRRVVSTRIPASLRKSATTSLGHFTCTRSTPHAASARATATPDRERQPAEVPGAALEAPQQRERQRARRAPTPTSARAGRAPRSATRPRGTCPKARPPRREREQPRAGRIHLVDDLKRTRAAVGPERAAIARHRGTRSASASR